MSGVCFMGNAIRKRCRQAFVALLAYVIIFTNKTDAAVTFN